MKQVLFILFIPILFIDQAFSQDFDQVEVTSEHVRDNIHVLFGAGGNIGVLAGEDGFVIVDDQFEPLADKIKSALGQIRSGEIIYAINTHFHFDHSDGNKAFGKEGTTIVAHENARKRLLENTLVQVPGFDTLVQEKYPVEALPVHTFDESIQLYINGESIEVFHVPNAHTDGDAIIFFERSNVFHMGDAFVRYGIPFIDAPNGGSVGGMIEAANTVLELCDEDTLIIPGHGQLSKKEDLIAFRDMLQTIWDNVAQQIAQGKTLADILDSKPAKGYAGELHADYIVLMIYQEQS